jgi:hypothetical protein
MSADADAAAAAARAALLLSAVGCLCSGISSSLMAADEESAADSSLRAGVNGDRPSMLDELLSACVIVGSMFDDPAPLPPLLLPSNAEYAFDGLGALGL